MNNINGLDTILANKQNFVIWLLLAGDWVRGNITYDWTVGFHFD
jgi:hypothetical protein